MGKRALHSGCSGSISACSPQPCYPGMGQSSPNRAEIPLWATGLQLRGPDRAAVTLLAVLQCWVQHPAPHHRGGAEAAGRLRAGARRGCCSPGHCLGFPRPFWVSGVGSPGCLSLPSLPRAFLGGAFLVCKGTSQGCFAWARLCLRLKGMNRVLLLSALHFALPPAAVPSPSQGRTDISNTQASSTFLLSVLSP